MRSRTLGSLLALALPLAAQGLDPASARTAFEEARRVSQRDGGRLWGRSLEGPMLLADTGAMRLIGNTADAEGRLKGLEGVFAGELPRELGVANTASEWAGRRWTLLHWPLGEDGGERRVLLAHEMFHRIQPELGLWVKEAGACTHLETRDGRLWLRLELRALRAALAAKGRARKEALADAMAFRAKRRSLFPQAARVEAALETQEGLAEYTGIRIGLAPEAARLRTIRKLEEADAHPHYARFFPYATGPALGLLLDEVRPGWRKGLKGDSDPSEGLRPRNRLEGVEAAASRHGWEAVRAEEDARETQRLVRVADLRKRYVDGPLLRVPMGHIVFNPSRQEAHAGLGIYNPTLKLTAAWGILTVTEGSLMAEDWSEVRVQAPGDTAVPPLHGPGWTLELKEGWELVPGKRSGDWIPRRKG